MRKSKELVYQEAIEQRMFQALKVSCLVTVLSFDRAKLTVDVKPLVHQANVSLPPILAVPVIYHKYDGESEPRLPLYSPGDIGVVLFLDCDSDNVLLMGTEAEPNSPRLHSGDDAVFLGCVRLWKE